MSFNFRRLENGDALLEFKGEALKVQRSRRRSAMKPRILLLFLLIVTVVLLGLYFVFVQTRKEGRTPVYPTTNDKFTAPTKDRPKKKLGYLFALKYYEQQTQAAKNYLQMQCLADSYGMQVVEPFVYLSSISFPFSVIQRKKKGRLLRFGDLIDMEVWNRQAVERYNYPPVAMWEEFLAYAPRNLVIVCVRYRDPPKIRIPIPGHNFRTGCPDACYSKFSSALSYLQPHGFHLVKKACANFIDYAGSVSAESFLSNFLIEGRHKSGDVTVILSEFRGFFGLYRLQVLSPCGILTSSRLNISNIPSQKLIREAEKYALANFHGAPYVSILVRVEKIVLHSRLNMTKCGLNVVSILQNLQTRRGLKECFLAMDVGRFGSSGAEANHLQPEGEKLFDLVYRKKWSFVEWEESFARSSSSTNPAYVANLQRTLASRGECLLMVGAGGFQAQARSLYETYHPDQSRRCVYKVCSEPSQRTTVT